MQRYRNNLSGMHAPGYRFRFQVRAISHRALFLPLAMKDHPHVVRLMNGEDPCAVFASGNIREARKAFNNFRASFDFPFWAATEFPVRDISDPDSIIYLYLNEDQHQLINIFLRRYHDRKFGRYIITKKGTAIGLSTCIQAYILWFQLFQSHQNIQICGRSNMHLGRFKENIARFQNRDTVDYNRYRFPIKNRYTAVFFNTFRKPDSMRGIDFGFVHLVDVAKWNDRDGIRSSRAIRAAQSGILLDHQTLVIIEGNVPSPKYNPAFFSGYTYASKHPDALYFPIDMEDFQPPGPPRHGTALSFSVSASAASEAMPSLAFSAPDSTASAEKESSCDLSSSFSQRENVLERGLK